MPAVDVITPGITQLPPPDSNQDDPGPIQTVVGIIYPPPEVRSILFFVKNNNNFAF